MLASAESSAGQTVAEGFFNSKPDQIYELQFFSNPSGTDEGKIFLGETSVTTNSGGNAIFTFDASQAAPATPPSSLRPRPWAAQ